MKITKEELAAMIDGRKYPFELTNEEKKLAKENNLVVIFGASDDLCEMRGSIEDEFECWNGSIIRCAEFPADLTAMWEPEGKNCDWAYETEMPNSEFKIIEEGKIYCIGIVVDLNDAIAFKPCPFCGKDDAMEFSLDEYDNIYVICNIANGGCGGSSGWRDNKKEAREAWNKRI